MSSLPDRAPGVPVNIDFLQDQIGRWGQETFNGFDLARMWAHLQAEIEELRAELFTGDGGVRDDYDAENLRLEAADCAIFLLRIAYEYGFSLGDAVQEKHRSNEQRSWTRFVAKGFYKHDEGER